ncbi:DUF4224 domain-containing protein [Roseateles sp. LKC17W]|uniref:DUF4224 domain-containing protein n=1 Tax=Pelomonas margarita TaxID=3299031 RepID=A0ABW7FIC1_9BURK
MLTLDDIALSDEQLVRITGYRQPAAQLRELLRQGFHRARRNPAGRVILERPHYEAVCAGREAPAANDTPLLRSQRRA